MRTRSSKLLIAFSIILVSSCGNSVEVTEEKRTRFDIEKYFKDEADMLNKNRAGITKTFFGSRPPEIITMDSVDWTKELQPFIQIRPDRPALLNSFQIDTQTHGNQLWITYAAIDSSVVLKELRIYMTGDRPDSIIAMTGTSNLYYSSADTIAYFGNGKYRIITNNKPRIGKPVAFRLEGVAVFKEQEN